MRRSRGFGLIELAIYAGLAIVLAGIVYKAETAFVAWIDHFGAEKQKAIDEPIIAALTKDRDTAVEANKTLQASVDRIDGERKQCSASVATWKELAERAAAAAERNNKTAQAAVDRLRADQSSALAKASSRSAQSCDAAMIELDKDSGELARIRSMLGLPDAPASGVRISK